MLLVASNLLEHMRDRPWPGCQVEVFGITITWMSSGIASMLIVALLLSAFLVICSRRRKEKAPKGPANLVEALVVFVRDMIARPALGERSYDHLSFLLTLFVFILGLNLFGLVPLQPLTGWLGTKIPWMEDRPMGTLATGIPTVCAGLAALALLWIVGTGLWQTARRYHRDRGWPMRKCLPLLPVLWFAGLSPRLPGLTGKIMVVPLALLEMIGAVVKCVALLIRLCANMVAGHILLAVLVMFALEAAAGALERNAAMWGLSVACVVATAVASLIDLLVAGLQAYIFTFLTATFLGIYTGGEH